MTISFVTRAVETPSGFAVGVLGRRAINLLGNCAIAQKVVDIAAGSR
jgi:hypothetical protein